MINFAEIPALSYDLWEQFSELLLMEMGYCIELSPARGPDGGRDMVVSKDSIRYIVSCKHFARRGAAVGVDDELNILERIKSFGAAGFIGVYSTLMSQGLADRLQGLKSNGAILDYKIYQSNVIEQFLLLNGCGNLVRQYFPASYNALRMANQIFDGLLSLPCAACGRNLIHTGEGIIVWATEYEGGVDFITNVKCACKGNCIFQVENHLIQINHGKNIALLSEELGWVTNSIGYWARVMRISNEVRSGQSVYTDEAWCEEQTINMALAQCVMRPSDAESRNLIKSLNSF